MIFELKSRGEFRKERKELRKAAGERSQGRVEVEDPCLKKRRGRGEGVSGRAPFSRVHRAPHEENGSGSGRQGNEKRNKGKRAGKGKI